MPPIIIIAIILAFAGAAFSRAQTPDTTLTVIVSGDAHGMIEACDCPQDPGGGLPKRATLIKQVRLSSQTLLLDSGGFSAGGIYDPYTEGRAADSARTEIMLRGMGALGYDAVAVGDDDLQLGYYWLHRRADSAEVPLVCANCFSKKGTPLFEQYRLVRKNGITFGITALLTTEKLFPYDSSVVVGDPARTLKKILPQLIKKSDYQIVLAHAGQGFCDSITKSCPMVALIANGHRKQSTDALQSNGPTTIMQFGYLGKLLSFAVAKPEKPLLRIIRSGWLTVDNSVPDDSDMLRIVRPKQSVQTPARSDNFDLYIMSQCPYGLPALQEMVQLQKRAADAKVSVWFIGSVGADSLPTSLHGENEISDELLWLGLQALYPARWNEFLDRRSRSIAVSTGSIFDSMVVDKKRIERWVARNGPAALREHYRRSTRLGITASPTLLWNNRPFDREITRARVGFQLCQSGARPGVWCDSLPQCFEDGDCSKPGKTGLCKQAQCLFFDAHPFTFTTLVAESTVLHPEEEFARTTRQLFPAARFETVYAGSKSGQKLLQQFSPAALPWYSFEKTVDRETNFSKIQSGVKAQNGHYVFKDDIAPG
ncbi:MAG: hypothetical protein PHC61_19080, partial [Chitinivibrionales bacterium]|nr:hypothetical protein [Chitinivibrionales bacterium]